MAGVFLQHRLLSAGSIRSFFAVEGEQHEAGVQRGATTYRRDAHPGGSVQRPKRHINRIDTKKKSLRTVYEDFYFSVRKAGLEPARLAAPPPQDGASANFATSAEGTQK